LSLPGSKVELRFTERFLEPIDRGSFVFKPTPPLFRKYVEKTRKGEIITALVDGLTQAGLAVQTQTVSYSKAGSLIRLDCASPLKLLHEASADAKLSKALAADVPILNLVAEAVEPFGIGEVFAENDIAVIRAKTGKGSKATATKATELKYAEASVQPNETVYAFLSRILTRLGVMLRMGADHGELYLTAPHYDGDTLGTVVLDGNVAGNRAEGEWEIVDTNEMQFDFCEITGAAMDRDGETRANVPKARVKSTDINAQRPPFRKSQVLSYKPLFIRDTESRDKARARSAAFLALGLKADSAFYVRCKVHGLVTRGGSPWTVDTLYRVVSDLYGLDEVMWLSERTFTLDGNGQTTELVLVPKGYVRLGEA
jgi:hypothetical protein